MTQLTISIVLAFALMMILSRWRLWMGVLAAGIVFGLINYDIYVFLQLTIETFSTPANWFLVIGVGLIPVLGAIMRESVHLAEILNRLKKKKRLYLMMTPLLFGLLPIPGGALLSGPLLKDFDKNISNEHTTVINLWFRHLLIIVYPLSPSLIIAAQLAGLTIVQAVLAMIPVMLVMFVTGYFFLLRKIQDNSVDLPITDKKLGKRKTIQTLLIFLAAPILHIILSTTVLKEYERLSFLLAMLGSVIIAMISNRIRIRELLPIIKKSKFEQFSLLFLFLLLFLAMLKGYENLNILFQGFSPPIYVVGIMAFLLTFISGRIEIALSIVYPFIFSVYELTSFNSVLFAFVYFSLFTGYLISPLHPCMAFSVEYFQTSYKKVLRILLPLLLIPFLTVSIIFWLSNVLNNLP
ncbi:MAG: DUF401 family protein [Candidatus Cloacimonetes bacterium]|nr:DUF401 family protein [Candidatus Cloacimonadota bacterium]